MSESDDIVRALNDLMFGHLERRTCTAEAPMPPADKDRFRWSHPDSVQGQRFLNVVFATCPHCGLSFTCLPPQ